jgi:hypothetical protein
MHICTHPSIHRPTSKQPPKPPTTTKQQALARLHLDSTIQPRYVEEAYRLLKKSVIHVQAEDVTLEEDEEEEEMDEVALFRVCVFG